MMKSLFPSSAECECWWELLKCAQPSAAQTRPWLHQNTASCEEVAYSRKQTVLDNDLGEERRCCIKNIEGEREKRPWQTDQISFLNLWEGLQSSRSQEKKSFKCDQQLLTFLSFMENVSCCCLVGSLWSALAALSRSTEVNSTQHKNQFHTFYFTLH